MGVFRTHFFGNSFLGLFARACDKRVFLGAEANERLIKVFSDGLNVQVECVLIGGSPLVGVFLACNSHGIVVSNTIEQSELKILKSLGLNVFVLDGHANAAGNVICCNDNGAIVSPLLSNKQVSGVSKALDVDAVRHSIAGYSTVGMAVLASNKGFVIHPHATPKELDVVEKVLGVEGVVGTVNMGTPFPSLGAIANSFGVVVGEASSGFEIGRITQGLNLVSR